MKKIILMVILTGAVYSQDAEAQLQTMIDELDSIKKALEEQQSLSSPSWVKEQEDEIASRELTIRKFRAEYKIAIDMDSLINDDEGLKLHPDTKELYSGKVIKFYEGNKKREEGTYKDGKKYGEWTWWYMNGQKRREETYKDGEPHGLSTVWSKKGQKIQAFLYKEGGQVIETQWYKNGQKKNEETYSLEDARNFSRNGKLTAWYENGQKEYEGTNKDGEPHGFWTAWYENGQKKGEGIVDSRGGFAIESLDGETVKFISAECWTENGNECECNIQFRCK